MDLIELRMLSGPSAEFPRPAVRLTLAPEAGRVWDDPRWDQQTIAGLVARIASAAGVARPETLVRAGSAGQLVVALTWERRGTGRAMAEALASVLCADPEAAAGDLVARAADHVRSTPPGEPPDLIDPVVPTVAITGTNGKTTTTRMLARIGSRAGLYPGWSSTDGVFMDGRCVQAGDWSGPGGAREVLGHPAVSLAILETARGGLMQRGMSVSAIDVAVFTNVSTDHLGLAGLDTVEALAWAKATVLRVVRPSGWCVLNAEDPLVRDWYRVCPGRPWFFAVDAEGPDALIASRLGAPLTTVVAGRIVVRSGSEVIEDLVEVADVPATIAGLSRENIANALAAASAGLALGLDPGAVGEGLSRFQPDLADSEGRMNIWSVPVPGGSATVILDFAHNEAGAAALFRVARGLRPPGALVHASIGNAGDRTDEGIAEVGRLAAQAADTVALAAKSAFLRGRTQQELDALQLQGVLTGGGSLVENLPDEPSGLAAMLDRAGPGDVLAMMVHQDREACVSLLARHGAHPDSPRDIAEKAAAAHPVSTRGHGLPRVRDGQA